MLDKIIMIQRKIKSFITRKDFRRKLEAEGKGDDKWNMIYTMKRKIPCKKKECQAKFYQISLYVRFNPKVERARYYFKHGRPDLMRDFDMKLLEEVPQYKLVAEDFDKKIKLHEQEIEREKLLELEEKIKSNSEMNIKDKRM